jgi:hypothetical protein
MLFSPKEDKKIAQNIEIGNFNVGDKDPTTGKKIVYIAYQKEKKFIVSVDSDANTNWYTEKDMDFAPDFGEIDSQAGLLESLVHRIFPDRRNRIAYAKLLGNIIGTTLDEQRTTTAKRTLEEVKARIELHCREKVRMAYIKYAVLSVVTVGFLIGLTVFYRLELLAIAKDQDIFRIAVCTLLGGVGAFITTFARFQHYNGSIVAGLSIHRLDGFLRVFYGLIAGVIIALAIKGKVIAAFANDQQPWILYFFAMVAGASEILVPNLIKQTESQTNLRKLEQDNIVTSQNQTGSDTPEPVTSNPTASDTPEPVTPNPTASGTPEPVTPEITDSDTPEPVIQTLPNQTASAAPESEVPTTPDIDESATPGSESAMPANQ